MTEDSRTLRRARELRLAVDELCRRDADVCGVVEAYSRRAPSLYFALGRAGSLQLGLGLRAANYPSGLITPMYAELSALAPTAVEE